MDYLVSLQFFGSINPFRPKEAKNVMGRDLGGIVDLEPEEAASLLQNKERSILILDVRSTLENSRLRIPGSILIPIQEIQSRLNEIPKDCEVLVYCEHGYRSLQASAFLTQLGWDRIYNLRGGIVKWKGPVEGRDSNKE